jgi:Calx-beta domain/Carboxypeptidase regulatory-like domain
MVEVDRTGNTTGTDSVMVSTADGTAVGGAVCTAGVDYVSVTNQLVTFNPGESQKFVAVVLCGDGLTESDQTLMLTLTGANLGTPSTATLTINDTASLFRNAAGITINQNGTGAPYPSQITVAGGPVVLGSMRVTLYDLQTNNPDSLDVMLVAPGGQAFILTANAGGSNPSSPVTLNFTDTAGQVLPDNGPLATGDFEPTSYGSVQVFPAPAPSSFNLPGSTVGGTGTQTLFGNFGGTNSNGVWSLYVRDDTVTNDPQGSGNIAGGWGLEFLQTTAASASLSGRVMTADGRAIRNVDVVITGNTLAHPMTVTTGSFGWFTFDGLQSGETYVVTVNSRRFTFSTPSRVISLIDNVTDADFVADPEP